MQHKLWPLTWLQLKPQVIATGNTELQNFSVAWKEEHVGLYSYFDIIKNIIMKTIDFFRDNDANYIT